MYFIAKCEFRFDYACWMVETPRLRFMLHVFSCEGYSKAEALFPPIVNLTSSRVQDMLQWNWKLDGSRMQPIVIDIKPVPGNLLKFVQCKCKLSMKNPCGSNTYI